MNGEKRVPAGPVYLGCWSRGTMFEHAMVAWKHRKPAGEMVTLCGLPAMSLFEETDWMPEDVWGVPQCPECSRRVYEATRKKGRSENR